MPTFAFETGEIATFAADLQAAGQLVAKEVNGVVFKGAQAIKKQLRADAYASEHFKGMARAIDFDMHAGSFFGVGVVEAEIGPRSDAGSAGNIANVAYFGTSRGGGTVPDPLRALQAEAPNVEKYLLALVDKALGT